MTCVLETALVSAQAWRGVPSHFNFESPFDTAVSMTLAMTLTAFPGTVSPPTRLALRFGARPRP